MICCSFPFSFFFSLNYLMILVVAVNIYANISTCTYLHIFVFHVQKVSIVAVSPSRYLSWRRSSLEYLFAKESHLATVFGVLVSRDVISKVCAMSKKVPFLEKSNDLLGYDHNNNSIQQYST